MFNIDWKYLLQILLPPLLRKPKQIAWLSLITSQIRKIYSEFVQKRKLWIYDINFTGQVMYLEKKLQDIFNCPEIRILDGDFIQNLFFFYVTESHLPVFFDYANNENPYFFYNQEENNVVDFIVSVPCALSQEQILHLKQIIEQYKLVEKTYKIV